jgi:hypothetical protein
MMAQTLRDAELQKYYDEVIATMTTPGWKLLMEDVAGMKDTYSSIFSVGPDASLDFRRGQLDILQWLTGHKQFVEAALETLLAEEAR